MYGVYAYGTQAYGVTPGHFYAGNVIAFIDVLDMMEDVSVQMIPAVVSVLTNVSVTVVRASSEISVEVQEEFDVTTNAESVNRNAQVEVSYG